MEASTRYLLAGTSSIFAASGPAEQPAPTPAKPGVQQRHPGWTFHPGTLPPPEVSRQPNDWPVNPHFSSSNHPQKVWHIDEVRAGAGDEHYRYF